MGIYLVFYTEMTNFAAQNNEIERQDDISRILKG